MKKLFSTCMAFLMVALVFTSCFGDDDNHAEAEVNYAAAIDSLRFTDKADTLFANLIKEALCSEQLKVAGRASTFKEKAEIGYSSTVMAAAVCDTMANSDYIKVLQNVRLADVKSVIYSAHADSLAKEGMSSPEVVPISAFTAYLSLHSSFQGKAIRQYTRVFK